MDFILVLSPDGCMREGLAPDMDARAWSAPGAPSDLPVPRGSAAVNVPDFTRGHWDLAQ